MEQGTFDFNEQLRMSYGVSECCKAEAILLEQVPGALKVEKSNTKDDRRGTDYWILGVRGEPLSVDVKAREEDWAVKGKDDLALETWSVIEREIPGWTRSPNKRTDYILWLWQDTGRWCLVPFAMLCAVFVAKWKEWAETHQTARQFTPGSNGGWHSECVFVPRREVWRAIYERFGGVPN